MNDEDLKQVRSELTAPADAVRSEEPGAGEQATESAADNSKAKRVHDLVSAAPFAKVDMLPIEPPDQFCSKTSVAQLIEMLRAARTHVELEDVTNKLDRHTVLLDQLKHSIGQATKELTRAVTKRAAERTRQAEEQRKRKECEAKVAMAAKAARAQKELSYKKQSASLHIKHSTWGHLELRTFAAGDELAAAAKGANFLAAPFKLAASSAIASAFFDTPGQLIGDKGEDLGLLGRWPTEGPGCCAAQRL